MERLLQQHVFADIFSVTTRPVVPVLYRIFCLVALLSIMLSTMKADNGSAFITICAVKEV